MHCTYILYLHTVKPKTCYQTANLKNKIQPEIIPPNFEMIFRIQVTNLNWNEGKSDFKKLPLSKKYYETSRIIYYKNKTYYQTLRKHRLPKETYYQPPRNHHKKNVRTNFKKLSQKKQDIFITNSKHTIKI